MYINSFRIYLSTVAQTFAGIKCNSEFDFHDVFTSSVTHTLKLAEFIVIIPSVFELNTKTNHVAFWKPFASLYEKLYTFMSMKSGAADFQIVSNSTNKKIFIAQN